MNTKNSIIRQIWADGTPASRAQALAYIPTLPTAMERLAATGSMWV